ncbi:MAG: FAD binding domain-containing protein [Spirochaetales bacterium]|nr:FAD binding domain-containing protein [Spirochaetales bacterium]
MSRPVRFILNELPMDSCLPPGTVVLDFLRRDRRLTGTKEGCREGDCGACAVLLGALSGGGDGAVSYRAVNSCLLPLGDVEGKHLVSIEGLNPPRHVGDAPEQVSLTPVQQKLVDHGAIQCGFCTPGFVISLTGYLLGRYPWSYREAVEAVAGNICRCTGYASIKRAIADLVDQLGAAVQSRLGGSPDDRERSHLQALVDLGVVPQYFLAIPDRLRSLDVPPGGQDQGAGRTVVAGGTDLFVQRPQQLVEEPLSFLSGAARLRQVRVQEERLYLGAGITMEEVRRIPELEERLPGLVEALPLVASLPIRNRATLGGNIVNASPIGDLTVMLLALGATLGLNRDGSIREVPLERFFKGYKQLDLKAGERLEWIAVPLEEGSFSFEKVSRRRHLDIASVNSAAWIRVQGGHIEAVRLAAGGVAPVPLFLARSSACLAGRGLTDELLEQALDLAQEEISPISDVRGSERYKRLLLRQLLLAHFQKLVSQQMHGEVWV